MLNTHVTSNKRTCVHDIIRFTVHTRPFWIMATSEIDPHSNRSMPNIKK